MKIISLKIKNINSLKGEHYINFEDGTLADAGLFAIVGPTGSGKSTILDAITLALFNKIPRIKSEITKTVIEQLGIIITQHCKDSFAEVIYEVKEKKYCSHWSIEYNRNGNLNERKQELLEAETGNIIASGIREVVSKNSEIIGLSYEQFVQSMILAQGQFSKLLHAEKNDRNKLLEEITGAKIYRTLGIAAFRKQKDAEINLKSQKDKIGEVRILSDEDLEEKQSFLKTNLPIKKQVENDLILLKDKIEVKKNIHDISEKLNLKIKQLENSKEKLKEFEAQKNQLNLHNKLVVYKQDLLKYYDLVAEIEINKKEISDYKNRIENSQLEKEKILNQSKLLLKSELEEENLLEMLEAFRIKVTALKDEENAAREKAKNQSDKIDEKIKNIAQFDWKIERTENTIDIASKDIESINKSLKDNKVENIQDILNLKFSISNQINLASELILNSKLFLENSNTLNDLKIELVKLEKDLQLLKESLENDIKNLSIKTPIFQKLSLEKEKLEREKGLEHHRANLVEGEACPLCGALEHPYIQNYKEKLTDALNQNFNLLKNEIEAFEKNISNNKNRITLVAEQKEKLEIKLSNALQKQEKSKELLNDFCEKLNWKNEIEIEKWNTEKQNFEKKIKDLEKLEKQIIAKDLLKDLIEIQKNYNELREIFLLKKAERTSLYEGNDIVAEVNSIAQNIINNKKDLEQFNISKQKLENKEKQQTETANSIKENLLKAIVKEGFKDLEDLKNNILTEEKAELIRKTFANINREIDQLEGEKKSLEESLLNTKLKDDENTDLASLNAQYESKKIAFDELNTQLINFQLIIEKDAAERLRFQKMESELKKLQSELNLWSKMNSIIGDANGNKFSGFVQDLTLEQLINYANKRLTGLSDRFLIVLPSGEDKKDVLRVIDTHLGNTERAVSTLSGGETFKLSLAMALGLSDLAAKNVSIESLFVDEGFGTLDSEALEDALKVLEDMQSTSNKSIGIISHVSELKERISAKINLIPIGNGYSKIEISN
jgi:DNA repair protein SbcC/Rad50